MNLYGFSQYMGSGTDEDLYTVLTPRQRVIMYLWAEEGYSQMDIERILCNPPMSQRNISNEIERVRYSSASLFFGQNKTLADHLRLLVGV